MHICSSFSSSKQGISELYLFPNELELDTREPFSAFELDKFKPLLEFVKSTFKKGYISEII